MSVFAYNNERPFFTESSGVPLDAGYVYIGTASLDPRTNPITVYWDEAMTIPAAQPLRTSAGAIVRNGTRAAVFIAADTFSLRIENKSRVLVDNVPSTNGMVYGSADLIEYQQGSAGSVAQNVGDKLRQIISPEDFGAIGDGVVNDTLAVQACFDAAAATGNPVLFAAYRTYLISQITIPSNIELFGKNSALRTDNSLSGSSVSIIIGDGVKIDSLVVRSPGTETNSYMMTFGEGCRVGSVEIYVDAQRSGTAITLLKSDTHIDNVVCRNVDRPIHIDGSAEASPTIGNRIGFLNCTNFVRGFRATNTDRWVFGGYRIYGRSPNASYTAGHNGILITDSKYWQVGDGLIYQSGEHAIRLSGEARSVSNGKFGVATVIASGGCAFKINPYEVFATSNVICDGLYGVDVGDFSNSGTGDNKELLRISHADKVRFGFVYCDTSAETESGQYALKINDATNVSIGSLGGNNVNAGITFDRFADVGFDYQIFTGSVSTTTLTVTAVSGSSEGLIRVGTKIYNGVTYLGYVTALGTGTGGTGTYTLSQSSTVASTSLNGETDQYRATGSISGTTLTVTAVDASGFIVGSKIYRGETYYGYITALGTGTGGTGTYTLSQSGTASSGVITGRTRSSGPVTNLVIDNYAVVQAAGVGSGVVFDMNRQTIGDISINFNGANGWSTNLASFGGTPTVSGPIYFTGNIRGSVSPVINNKPASLVWMNVFYRGTVYT